MSIEQQQQPDVTEAWRTFHAGHLERQTRAVETIKTMVLVWFWLSIAGAFLFVTLGMASAARF